MEIYYSSSNFLIIYPYEKYQNDLTFELPRIVLESNITSYFDFETKPQHDLLKGSSLYGMGDLVGIVYCVWSTGDLAGIVWFV